MPPPTPSAPTFGPPVAVAPGRGAKRTTVRVVRWLLWVGTTPRTEGARLLVRDGKGQALKMVNGSRGPFSIVDLRHRVPADEQVIAHELGQVLLAPTVRILVGDLRRCFESGDDAGAAGALTLSFPDEAPPSAP